MKLNQISCFKKNQVFQQLYLICQVVGIILCWKTNIFAQSQNIKLDLLQGRWMFRALHGQLNSDISTNTTSFNPYNIHFEIKNDTCMMIRLTDITPKNHIYDTSLFTISVINDQLLFFPLTKNPFKKPTYQLKIKQLNNQTLTLIDPEAKQHTPSLLVRSSEFTFTFTRHDDLYKQKLNAQRQLKGKWYVEEHFLAAISAEKDSLIATKNPKSYERKVEYYGTECDTIVRYSCLIIDDETWKIKDSVDFKPCQKNAEKLWAIDAPEEIFSMVDLSIYYYIVPNKQLIEISIPTVTQEKEVNGFPKVIRKMHVYNYILSENQMLLLKRNKS